MLKGISKSCLSIIFNKSTVYNDDIESINGENISYSTLIASKCDFQSVASGLGLFLLQKDAADKYVRDDNYYSKDSRIIDILHKIGANTPDHFTSLGMDCVDLNEIPWLERLIILFGKEEVLKAAEMISDKIKFYLKKRSQLKI